MNSFRIEPDRYYEEETLRIMGIDGDVLKRACERGELRFRDLGDGTTRYKGAWVIAWLDREVEAVAK